MSALLLPPHTIFILYQQAYFLSPRFRKDIEISHNTRPIIYVNCNTANATFCQQAYLSGNNGV